MILTGKTLGGGLPLAGVTGRAEVMDAPHAGGLGGTFSGNPLACRAGIELLRLLDAPMLAKSVQIGKKVMEAFRSMQDRFEIIGDVRGLGPMVALELVKSRETKEPAADEAREMVKRCREKGLILLSCGVHHNVVRTLIPFAITDGQLEKGFRIMEEALDAMSRA